MPIDIRNCVFKFQCNKLWEELKPTNKDGVKFCNSCRRQVYLCETGGELMRAIKHDRCVAIKVKQISNRGKSEMPMGELLYFGEQNVKGIKRYH